MNGLPLPTRMTSPPGSSWPGLFGFVSATKWLERIEFTTNAELAAY